jgi:hypothetical protein
MTIKRLPYEVILEDFHGSAHAEVWCEEQFGKRWGPSSDRFGNWAALSVPRLLSAPTKIKFLFANEKDAIFFKLRWS